MGFIDDYLYFSDAQTLTGITSASAVTSEDIIDLGANGLDAWQNATSNKLDGASLHFNVQVGATAVTTAPIVCRLYSHTAATSITSGTEIARIVLNSSASAPNYGSAGKRVSVGFPQGQTLNRYLGVSYIGSAGNPGDIPVDAWLGAPMETNYSDAA